MGFLRKLGGIFGTGSSAHIGSPNLNSWNQMGRAKNQMVCEALEAIIDRDESSDEDLAEDERSQALGDAVLERVVALHAAGDWQQARAQVDAAHQPFVPHMNDVGLRGVVILGLDRFLVRRGDEVLHVNGDTVSAVAGVHAFAISRDRRWLALARADGLIVKPGYDAPEGAVIPWPDGLEVDTTGLRCLDIADNGQTVAMASDDIGIWLLHGSNWMPLAPRHGVGDDENQEKDEEDGGDEAPPATAPSSQSNDSCGIQFGTYAELRARFGSELGLDACHVALSPDGQWVAYGWQDAYGGHYVDQINNGAKATVLVPKGQVAARSDYPYAVRFTDDSRQVLSNSRHMQNGVTVCCALESMCLSDESDEEDGGGGSLTTDDYLRAYGMTVLPGATFGLQEPVAWIGGAGWSHAATLSGGKPVFTHFFGSALNAIDFDPVTRRVAVASASGMLHVLDPSAEAEVGRERGYHPRQELYRWLFWDGLQKPVRW